MVVEQVGGYILKPRTYSLDHKFTFGKYQGKTVKELLYTNPFYIQWCVHNISNFNLSGGAQQEAFRVFNNRIRPTLERGRR